MALHALRKMLKCIALCGILALCLQSTDGSELTELLDQEQATSQTLKGRGGFLAATGSFRLSGLVPREASLGEGIENQATIADLKVQTSRQAATIADLQAQVARLTQNSQQHESSEATTPLDAANELTDVDTVQEEKQNTKQQLDPQLSELGEEGGWISRRRVSEFSGTERAKKAAASTQAMNDAIKISVYEFMSVAKENAKWISVEDDQLCVLGKKDSSYCLKFSKVTAAPSSAPSSSAPSSAPSSSSKWSSRSPPSSSKWSSSSDDDSSHTRRRRDDDSSQTRRRRDDDSSNTRRRRNSSAETVTSARRLLGRRDTGDKNVPSGQGFKFQYTAEIVSEGHRTNNETEPLKPNSVMAVISRAEVPGEEGVYDQNFFTLQHNKMEIPMASKDDDSASDAPESVFRVEFVKVTVCKAERLERNQAPSDVAAFTPGSEEQAAVKDPQAAAAATEAAAAANEAAAAATEAAATATEAAAAATEAAATATEAATAPAQPNTKHRASSTELGEGETGIDEDSAGAHQMQQQMGGRMPQDMPQGTPSQTPPMAQTAQVAALDSWRESIQLAAQYGPTGCQVEKLILTTELCKVTGNEASGKARKADCKTTNGGEDPDFWDRCSNCPDFQQYNTPTTASRSLLGRRDAGGEVTCGACMMCKRSADASCHGSYDQSTCEAEDTKNKWCGDDLCAECAFEFKAYAFDQEAEMIAAMVI